MDSGQAIESLYTFLLFFDQIYSGVTAENDSESIYLSYANVIDKVCISSSSFAES